MAQDKEDTYRTDRKDSADTGSDLPHGDGTTSDEDTKKITEGQKLPTTPGGQDHSLDNYEDSEPTSGIGTFGDDTEARVEGE